MGMMDMSSVNLQIQNAVVGQNAPGLPSPTTTTRDATQ